MAGPQNANTKLISFDIPRTDKAPQGLCRAPQCARSIERSYIRNHKLAWLLSGEFLEIFRIVAVWNPVTPRSKFLDAQCSFHDGWHDLMDRNDGVGSFNDAPFEPRVAPSREKA